MRLWEGGLEEEVGEAKGKGAVTVIGGCWGLAPTGLQKFHERRGKNSRDSYLIQTIYD